MKYRNLLLAITLATGTPQAICEEMVIDSPMAATTLKLAEHNVSAFYTVDEETYKVVVAFSVGPLESEQLIRQTFQLVDGQSYSLSIGGYGLNDQASTLRLTRKQGRILAETVNCESREKIASCI